MIDQLIPLGELGVLLGIWKRLGDLRQDTDRNDRRIDQLKKRVKRLEQLVRKRRKPAAARSDD